MKKTSKKPAELTGKQARYLRGLGHHLSPKVHIGKDGLTENLVKSTLETLKAHELIKVKIQENCPLDRKEAADQLAGKTSSSVAQILGKIFLLYRENPDLKGDNKITLP